MPAIGSAVVLAFLASFENYNTTTFTFMDYPTLTIELSQKVRLGINPSVSALAFIIVTLTVFFALFNEVRTRRAQLAVANGAPVGAVNKGGFQVPKFFAGNPIAAVFALFVAGAVGTMVYAQFYDPEPAKAVYLKEKRVAQQLRIEALQKRLKEERAAKQMKGPKVFENKDGGAKNPGKGAFGNIWNADNLDKVNPTTDKKKTPAKKNPGKGAFGGVFDTKNLDEVKPKE